MTTPHLPWTPAEQSEHNSSGTQKETSPGGISELAAHADGGSAKPIPRFRADPFLLSEQKLPTGLLEPGTSTTRGNHHESRDPQDHYELGCIPTRNFMAASTLHQNDPVVQPGAFAAALLAGGDPPLGHVDHVEQAGGEVSTEVPRPDWMKRIDASAAKRAKAKREAREKAEQEKQARTAEREKKAAESNSNSGSGTSSNAVQLEQERIRKYLVTVLTNQCDEFARVTEGSRNNELYKAALKLGNYIHYGVYTEQDVRESLKTAAKKNKLWQDDGARNTLETIASGLRNGTAKPKDVPAPAFSASNTLGDDDLESVNNPETWAPQYQHLRLVTPTSPASPSSPASVSSPASPKVWVPVSTPASGNTTTSSSSASQGAPKASVTPQVSSSGSSNAAGNPAGSSSTVPRFNTDFFNQTDVLKHIQESAHHVGSSAQGYLTMALARVNLEAGPHVLIPKIAGSITALNTGFLLVANAGGGKSSSMKEAGRLLGLYESQLSLIKVPSSGEGMMESFLYKPVKGSAFVLRPDPRRLFKVDEIETLDKSTMRNGSTLGPTLRTGLMGEHMGTENTADGGRQRDVPENSYRMVMVAGAQPSAVQFLLSGNDVGLPQRFLWIWLEDETVPDEDDAPADPGLLNWTSPWPDYTGSPDYLEVEEPIRKEIRTYVRRVNQGKEQDGRKAHLNLLRLKTAANLAALHREFHVTQYWWEMAGQLTDHSLLVQEYCTSLLSKKIAIENKRKGLADGHRQFVTESVLEQRRMDDLINKILRKLEAANGVPLARREIVNSLTPKNRALFDEAAELMVDNNLITIEKTGGQGVSGRPGFIYKLRKVDSI